MIQCKYAVTLVAAGLFALAPLGLSQEPGQSGQMPGSRPQTDRAPMGQSDTRPGMDDRTANHEASNESADHKFVMKAAQGDAAEIQMGQLAQEKASSDGVKQYAKQLVDDHTKSLDQLKQIAQSKGISLETQPDKKHQSAYDKLSKMSGPDFDKEFISRQMKDHKKDISEFKRQAEKGRDADIKNFAQQQISGLEHHLQMAQSLSGETKTTAANRSEQSGTSK